MRDTETDDGIVVSRRLVTRIPDVLSFEEAAAIPEAFITAHDALLQCGLVAGEEAGGEFDFGRDHSTDGSVSTVRVISGATRRVFLTRHFSAVRRAPTSRVSCPSGQT